MIRWWTSGKVKKLQIYGLLTLTCYFTSGIAGSRSESGGYVDQIRTKLDHYREDYVLEVIDVVAVCDFTAVRVHGDVDVETGAQTTT